MQDSWPSGADNYVLKHQIGKGNTANVWHATCTTTGEDVAIKIIDLDSCSLSIEEIRVSKKIYYSFSVFLNFFLIISFFFFGICDW